MEEDSYKTIEGTGEGIFKDKSSKFLAFAYHVETVEEINERVEVLRKEYYDARHHCYAWRLGQNGEPYRINDDREPSGSAGKPIYGQLLSMELTDVLVVVVRYFGGTKLGVPGLINAYRQATVEALESVKVVEKTVDAYYNVHFPYEVLNNIMKVVKDMNPRVLESIYDNSCSMELAIRRSESEKMEAMLEKIEGAKVDLIKYK